MDMIKIDGPKAIVPEFNSLVAFLVPREHWVSEMQEGSPLRYTLFGWLHDYEPYPSGALRPLGSGNPAPGISSSGKAAKWIESNREAMAAMAWAFCGLVIDLRTAMFAIAAVNVGMAGLHAVAAGSRDAATLLRVAAGRLGIANSAKLWRIQYSENPACRMAFVFSWLLVILELIGLFVLVPAAVIENINHAERVVYAIPPMLMATVLDVYFAYVVWSRKLQLEGSEGNALSNA
eukprot:s1426_g2.t1